MSEVTADLGLRQRKISPDVHGDQSERVAEKYLETIASKSPDSFKPYIQVIAPHIVTAARGIQICISYIVILSQQLYTFWKYISPYRPELLLPSIAGLIMCFFGGSFLTVIAAAEAYRMCGYDTTLKCLQDLYADYEAFSLASERDDKTDANNDGVPDVKEISTDEFAQRKLILFLKTVDPKRLTGAVAGINSGFLAVVAALRLQFVKAITLGNALGDIINKPAQRYIVPQLEQAMGHEYKKWASPLVEMITKTQAIAIAWSIQRVISAYHSSIRGGLLFSRNLLVYLSVMEYIKINHEDTLIDEFVGYGLALVGLWFQLSFRFMLPFPLNVLLFPFTIIEWFLMWIVAK